MTNPGQQPGEPSVIAEDASDDYGEFPSEATRIDPAFLSAQAPPPKAKATTGSLEALAASRAQSRQSEVAPTPQRERPAPIKSNNKLAALQSLSLDGGASSTRLPPAPRHQGGSKLPWAILFIIGAGFGGKYAYEKYAVPPPPPAPTTRTETVQKTGGSGQQYAAGGFTAARDPIVIGAPSGGAVKDVRVHENDHVTKGQIIVEMDSSAAQADLSAVHTEVSELEGAYRQQEMLQKAGAATVVQVAQAKSAIAIARAKARGPEQRIAIAHVRASTTGNVLEVLAHPGETVPINGPVMKIADLKNLVAEVDVNETDVVKIRHGQPVDVTSDSFPGKTVKGTVGLISEQADKARGTVLVRVNLVPSDELSKTNMTVKCTFLPLEGEAPRIFVSRTAVTQQGNVFVVGPNRVATSRPVKVGMAQGAQVEIVSGLTPGDQIVTDASGIRDGQTLP